jgi:ribulose-phosphate 3-epimerase
VRAYVSLWSADQLALGGAVQALDPHVDGFHLDVMDGHFTPELLFGAETVRALAARRPAALIDVHLVVGDADRWITSFAAAGADMLTVYPESCADAAATLRAIERHGVRPGLALSLDQRSRPRSGSSRNADRVLVMGTAIGIKGADLAPEACARVARIRAARDESRRRPEIVVDGGIREHTIPRIAQAGADGVVPGSLVLGYADWLTGVRFIHAQPAGETP